MRSNSAYSAVGVVPGPAAVDPPLERLELAIPVDQPAPDAPDVDRGDGAQHRQDDGQDADHAQQRRGVVADEGRVGERHAHAVGPRRDVLQHDGQLALLVDDAGVVGDVELRVVGGRELARAIEQHRVAVLVEARLGVVHDGMREQRHERRLHVGAHHQGDAGRQQRDVVAGNQRDRTPPRPGAAPPCSTRESGWCRPRPPA